MPPTSEWRPPPLRLTVSALNDKAEKNLAAPWLSFNLTIEFRHPDAPASEFFYQHTVCGCIYTPFQKGVNGSFGKFKGPTAFGRGGYIVNSSHIQPDAFIAKIEQALKAFDEVLIWTKQIEKEYMRLGVDPRNETQMKHFKKGLKRRKPTKLSSQ